MQSLFASLVCVLHGVISSCVGNVILGLVLYITSNWYNCISVMQ